MAWEPQDAPSERFAQHGGSSERSDWWTRVAVARLGRRWVAKNPLPTAVPRRKPASAGVAEVARFPSAQEESSTGAQLRAWGEAECLGVPDDPNGPLLHSLPQPRHFS
jgi:hypothetical protein